MSATANTPPAQKSAQSSGPFSEFRQSRWFKPLVWVGSLFLAYVLIGFLVLPLIIKSQLLKQLPVITQRQAAVRQVQFNPLVLSLTIRGLSLTEPDGAVFASWEELYVNFQLSSLFRLAWSFDEIGLKQPLGHVILLENGQFNFSNMLEKAGTEEPAPPAPASGLPRIHVGHLHLDQGTVVVDDRTHRVPLHSEITPINLSLSNLTTRPNLDSIYSVVAESDAGTFTWTGNLTVDPFQSSGRFKLDSGAVGKSTPVVRDFARAEITKGRLNVGADYHVGLTTNGLDAVLTNATVQLTGLEVVDLRSGQPVTAISSLTVAPIDFNLLRRDAHVGQIKISGYSKVVRIEKDGSINLNMLLEPQTAAPASTNSTPAKPAAPWTVSVDEFIFEKGSVSFADLSRTPPFETRLSPIQFQLNQFTTRPDAKAHYSFRVQSDAGETVSGTGAISIAPVSSEGGIKLAGLDLKRYATYYQDFLQGELLGGKMDAGVDYRFLAASNAPLVTVSNAAVALSGLQLKTPDTGETVISIPAFAVEQTTANLEERSVEVGLVKSSGGSVRARQHKDGSINLLGLIKSPPPAPSNPAEPAPDPGPAWTVRVNEIALEDYTIALEDQKPDPPVPLHLSQLRLNLKGLSLESNAPITAAFSVRLNESGEFRADGIAQLQPPAANLDIALHSLDLRAFQPYLNEQARLSISSGILNTKGRVHYAPPSPDDPLLQFTGEVGLTNFLTTDQVFSNQFVQWDALLVRNIDLTLQPDKLQIGEVQWFGFDTRLIIGSNGQVNVTSILPEKTESNDVADPTPQPAAPTTAGGFPVELAALILENASLHFTDQSIIPPCQFDVRTLSGSIRDLSSSGQRAAVLDLTGKVTETAPFSISGTVNPLGENLMVDLKMAFTNTDLTPLTPYLEKYVGHPMTRGKLNMALRYDIQQNELKAENHFQINKLTLGPRNQSPDATDLPVKLAVALMKDRNGSIGLEVPLSGKLDDPDFGVLPVIRKTILNLITKAATSPFSLLGAAFGGGEELSFVSFQPGHADIPEGEGKKLDKLAKALFERPELSLEIVGAADPDQDRLELARLKLQDQIKAVRLQELSKAGGAEPAAGSVPVDPADQPQLLAILFFQCAETNRALLPETNLLARLTATNTVMETAPPLTNALPDAAPPALERPPVPAPEPPVASPPKRKLQFFSADKGATLLRTRPSRAAPALSPEPEPRPAGRDVPIAPPEPSPVEAMVPAAPPPPATPAALAKSLGLTTETMETRLLKAIPVSDEDLLDLMKRRAETVREHLRQSQQLDAERLFVQPPKAVAGSSPGESKVHLSLN